MRETGSADLMISTETQALGSRNLLSCLYQSRAMLESRITCGSSAGCNTATINQYSINQSIKQEQGFSHRQGGVKIFDAWSSNLT